MNIIQKYKNWRNAENPAPFDLEHIKRVIVAYCRKWLPNTSKHIHEQAEWRLTQIRAVCKNQNTCVICGCDVKGLVYEDNPCKGNCYPAMMSKKDWNKTKAHLKIN